MAQKKIKNGCLLMMISILAILCMLSSGCNKPSFEESAAADIQDSISVKALVNIPYQAPVSFPADLLSTFQPRSWMDKISSAVKISHLSIPGTRWSAKYQSGSSAQYQTKSISQQLDMGVRYLHISVTQNPGLSVVTGNSTLPFSSFVDTVKTFLIQNPSEAVIILLEQTDNLPYPGNFEGHIRTDPNAQYFYKWPNYYSAASASIADWPSLGQLRGKMMLLSHSTLLKSTHVARVVGDSKIPLGWTTDGAAKVDASIYHQLSNTTGNSKIDAVYSYLVQADNAPGDVYRLFLNETGTDQSSTAEIVSDVNHVNTKIDDVLEAQYNENYNYGRFGIIAMNYLSDYTSKLIYLTNFNRYNKAFKATVLGSGAFPYSSDFAIPGYPLSQLYSHYTEVPNGNTPGSYSFPLSVWDHFPAKDWMSKIPDYTRLSMINIPGTHDAGTSTGSLLGKCQDWTIAQQLDYGVRFLDLRLTYYSAGVLRVHHGSEVYDITWEQVLTTLTDFLSTHPRETIILKVQLTDDTGLGQPLFTSQINSSGKAGYFWQGTSATTNWPLMGALRGKILLLQSNRGVQYGSIDWSHPDNTNGAAATTSVYNSSSSLLGYVQDRYTMDEYHLPTLYNNKWNLIQNCFDWAHYDITVDDYNKLYLNYTSLAPINPRDAANSINPRLKTYIDNEFSGPYDVARRSGIYVSDFVDWKMTSSIFLTNFSRTQVMNAF